MFLKISGQRVQEELHTFGLPLNEMLRGKCAMTLTIPVRSKAVPEGLREIREGKTSLWREI